MKIFTTMMAFSDVSPGIIYKVDTIEHQGKMWLVPEWLDCPREGWRKPARLICLDILPHQKSQGGPADFVLTYGIPKSVFYDGQIPPQSEYMFVILDRPDIEFPSIGG